MEESIKSNDTTHLRDVVSNIWSSNYFWKCSFSVIIILIFIAVKLYDRYSNRSMPIRPFGSTQYSLPPRNSWPKIHQRSMSPKPKLYNPNLHRRVIDAPLTIVTCTSSMPSSTQSENTINATDTVSLWSKFSQHVVQCTIAYQEHVESGGCGLENFGHSCYINSALQCLCHIRSFIDIILNLQGQQHQQQLPPITSAYSQLLTEMQSNPKGSTSAHELKARISNINQRFVGTDEQDSHEFLTILLEALHDELMDNYQNSSIGDIMHGIIRSTVRCLECGEETQTNDSFLSLPLPIQRSNTTILSSNTTQNIFWRSIDFFSSFFGKNVTLYGCFQDFLSLEQLGKNGQWFCEKCRNLTDATKRFDLWQLPKVLILQLKRFTCDLTNNTKLTTKIRFDHQLDLNNLLKKDDQDPHLLYDLVAVLTHSGTLASGHYTTFAKHLDNGCWYHFNDQHVRQALLYEVLTSDAYILVYERQYSHSSS